MEGRPRSNRGSRPAAEVAELLAPGLERVSIAARTGPFSSDLTPSDLALCDGLGLRPVVQVMGACAYAIGVGGAPVLGDPGHREFFSRGGRSRPVMLELRRWSAAYDQARGAALGRLSEQAAAAGAHLVVGVDVHLTEEETGDGRSLGFVASGNAVRLRGEPATRSPRLTRLSVADLWRLRAAGYEPAGLVAATIVYHARPSFATAQALARRRRGAVPDQELTEFSTAADSARKLCRGRMEAGTRRRPGYGIVDMSLELTHALSPELTGQEAWVASSRYAGLHLTVHGIADVIGPAVTRGGRREGERIGATPVLWLT